MIRKGQSYKITGTAGCPMNIWSPNVRSGGWLGAFEQRRNLFGRSPQHE